jgi:hypothetical protein
MEMIDDADRNANREIEEEEFTRLFEGTDVFGETGDYKLPEHNGRYHYVIHSQISEGGSLYLLTSVDNEIHLFEYQIKDWYQTREEYE